MTKKTDRTSSIVIRKNIIIVNIVFQNYTKANIYIAAFLIAGNLL